jgi:hypothetical protein
MTSHLRQAELNLDQVVIPRQLSAEAWLVIANRTLATSHYSHHSGRDIGHFSAQPVRVRVIVGSLTSALGLDTPAVMVHLSVLSPDIPSKLCADNLGNGYCRLPTSIRSVDRDAGSPGEDIFEGAVRLTVDPTLALVSCRSG